MAIIVCPVCGAEMSDKASRCPVCEYPVGDLEEIRKKREEENTEYITVCNRCCHFAIVRKKDFKNLCAMCGTGEITPVMSRKEWFAMPESGRDKAAGRAVNAIKTSYKYNALLHRQYGSRVRIDKNVLVYCPRCGQYTSAHFAAERGNACTYCGTEYRFTDSLYHDVHDKVMATMEAQANAGRDPSAKDDEKKPIKKADYVRAMDDYVMEHYLINERFFNGDEMNKRRKGQS